MHGLLVPRHPPSALREKLITARSTFPLPPGTTRSNLASSQGGVVFEAGFGNDVSWLSKVAEPVVQAFDAMLKAPAIRLIRHRLAPA